LVSHRRGGIHIIVPVRYTYCKSPGKLKFSLKGTPGKPWPMYLLHGIIVLFSLESQNIPAAPEEISQPLPKEFTINDACSAYLSIIDPHPEESSALEELCFMVMGFLQKPQSLEEKENTKRFLFHYSKTHDSGNSDMSSVLHPLLQLVPQLHERRLKRYKADVCNFKLCILAVTVGQFRQFTTQTSKRNIDNYIIIPKFHLNVNIPV
uniref:Neuromedin U n=1 Tax=Chelydra serpentina TaxID=8475 RepID=A0A8C3S255_CHESE